MKIRYGSVKVFIGAPFNENFARTFRVKEGESFVKKGMMLGRIILTEFTESHFDNPTPKDFRYIENISKIKVNKILP